MACAVSRSVTRWCCCLGTCGSVTPRAFVDGYAVRGEAAQPLSARLADLSACFTEGGVARARTCSVPPGPRVSIVTLGPPAIGGRSGDSIF